MKKCKEQIVKKYKEREKDMGETKLNSDILDNLCYAMSPDVTIKIDKEFSDICKEINDINENKEENSMYANKIIDIYESRKRSKIREKYEDEKKEILKEDIFQNLSKQFENQVKELYKNEFDKEMPYEISALNNLYSKETEIKLKKLDEYLTKELDSLESSLKEVNAQLSLVLVDDVNAYDITVKILKNYKILNKNGKINA